MCFFFVCVCDLQSMPQFVGESANCEYSFTWGTPSACPQQVCIYSLNLSHLLTHNRCVSLNLSQLLTHNRCVFTKSLPSHLWQVSIH